MIKVGELKFSYGKDKQILHGLNFEVKEGEIFGFLDLMVQENPQHRKS